MAMETSQQHVVFMNMAATGHMNPTLTVVAALVARGCKVTYFVEETMREVVEAAGASWRPFRYPKSKFTGILRNWDSYLQLHPEELEEAGVPAGTPTEDYVFPTSLVFNAQLVLPQLLEDLGGLSPRPSLIAYEPFLACARAAAHAFGVPHASFFTMAGPGVMEIPDHARDAWESLPWVQKPRRWIQERYGLDLLGDGALMEFYSPMQNLVTTIVELYRPPLMEYQVRRFGHFPFHCVGALADPKVTRIQNAGDGLRPVTLSSGSGAEQDAELTAGFSSSGLPLQRVREARAAGRRVVLVSLGTVVTERMWTLPLGRPSLCNDGRPDGAKSITEYTGKEFCQYVYKACFEAFSRDTNILAIFAMGTNGADALQGLPEPPGDVVLRESVPQLQLLPLCDAFITHGGCNSMHEALAAAVPMCVVPVFGDQAPNADAVARAGAGVSFRHPLRTLCSDALSAALQEMLSSPGGEPNRFQAGARRVSRLLAAASGVRGAVDALLKVAAGPTTPHGLPRVEAKPRSELPCLMGSMSALSEPGAKDGIQVLASA